MRKLTKLLFLAGVPLISLQELRPTALAAPETTNSPSSALSAQEKSGCSNNLAQIFGAIQAFQRAKKDLPNWLSDLVPQYLPDANILTCPACRRTGRIEPAPLADPKISSSYLFEFCPVPLGGILPDAPERTRREWKRRQMGLVGSAVPMVRCRHHEGQALNLAFDGRIYESNAQWEQSFTNVVSLDDLNPPKLFAGDPPPKPKPAKGGKYPPRDPAASQAQLNLTPFYNLGLSEPLPGRATNALATLPRGLRKLAGTEFDIRGIIQLSGRSITNKNWPREMKGLPVKQKAKRLHFLHAASAGTNEDEGKQAGSYVVHFSNQKARLEIPIIYGQAMRHWQPQPDEKERPAELVLAWSSDADPQKLPGPKARLFKMSWDTLAPGLEIDKIDFVSSAGGPAPFLVAISVE